MSKQTKEEQKAYRKQYRLDNKEKIREYQKQYRLDNKEKRNEYHKQWYLDNKEYHKQWELDNKEKRKEYKIQYRLDNKEYFKQWRLDNKEEIQEYKIQYHLDNKEKVSKARSKYVFKRYHSDPLYKFKRNCRSRTHTAFKKKSWRKNGGTEKLLGCDYQTAMNHIESQFVDDKKWMTWENHGEWHIDHDTPLASANTIEEMTPLFHYTNLVPLLAEDNIRKGDRIYT